MNDDESLYPEMKEVGDASRKVLDNISKESLVHLIVPLAEKLEKRDLLDDLQVYRLVEDIYFCKDSKVPEYLKKACYVVHVMCPNWD